MHTFKDSKGRQWEIAMTLGNVKRVRDTLHIDLLQPEAGDPPLLQRLGVDEFLLAEVIEKFLEPQFAEKGTTADDVMAAFDGETILAAQSAFYDEMVAFFQSRGRNDRAKAVQKQQAVIKAATAAAVQQIEDFDVEKAIRGEMS